MAFPYDFEENFELGTRGDFDSETDTVGQLDFPDYKELSRFPFLGFVPFSGAFAARWSLTGGTADAFMTEGDVDISAAAESFFRFPLYFSPDFSATADDTVHLFELLATATIEAVVGFRIVAATGVINLGIGELAPTAFSGVAIERGVYYTVELRALIDDGGSNNGTLGLFITKDGDPDGVEEVTVSSLDQGAITSGLLGVQNHLATTTGTILISDFVQDDARSFPLKRYPDTVEITKSRHVFLGRGTVSFLALLSAAASNSLTLHDTDDGVATDGNKLIELTVGAQINHDEPLLFTKGCFANLTGGTDPRGEVILPTTGEGPNLYNDSGVKRLGLST